MTHGSVRLPHKLVMPCLLLSGLRLNVGAGCTTSLYIYIYIFIFVLFCAIHRKITFMVSVSSDKVQKSSVQVVSLMLADSMEVKSPMVQ